MTEAYPLQWPAGRPRSRTVQESRFKTQFWPAVQFVLNEIRRLGASNSVISTNIELRQDGLPYANRRAPDDKGVAVYFTYRGKSMCFACDKWDKVGDNIYAVGKTIEALRGIERWGTGEMVEQAFHGFVALPSAKTPWEVLGLQPGATESEIDAAWRSLARVMHPDKAGGSQLAMQDLNEARRRLKAGAA